MKAAGLAVLLALVRAAAGEPLRGPASLVEKPYGVLLLGDGGDREWREAVDQIKKRAGKRYPVEFSGGSADGKAMQTGLDKLQDQRVRAVVVVPLFVSSYGEVMDQVRYLMGIREKPSEAFAGPRARAAAPPARLRSRVPLVLTKALDDHPLFVDLLAARAQALSRKPHEEALILVGEAPASKPGDKTHAGETEWLQAAETLAEKVRKKGGFAAARPYALRLGSAPKDRDACEAGLRSLVKDLRGKHKVIVVPLAMTGGRLRLARPLDGLFAKFDGRAVLPDPRIPQWVDDVSAPAAKLPDMRLFKDAARAGLTPAALARPASLPSPGENR